METDSNACYLRDKVDFKTIYCSLCSTRSYRPVLNYFHIVSFAHMSRIKKLPKNYNEYSLEELKKIVNEQTEQQKKRRKRRLR
jgi:hypothetical protein